MIFNYREDILSNSGQNQPQNKTFADWIALYMENAIIDQRSPAITRKIQNHLGQFRAYFLERYGHERLNACVKRDVLAWRESLQARDLAPATVNNYMASLSGFATWVTAQDAVAFPSGDPTKGIGELSLPPLEPRALNDDQIRSLKNLCDRLPNFYRFKGRRWSRWQRAPIRSQGRPLRDRAMIFLLLSTGLRREELVSLNLSQLDPYIPYDLRRAKRARVHRVRGKGKTQRDVFLSSDARHAIAEYLTEEHERDRDPSLDAENCPLFLSAVGAKNRSADGRLSLRAINMILEQIGRWHDAEFDDPARHISPLRPHDLRHTFAFQLAKVTGADPYELERRLGHSSQRYIQRYTNPPEAVAASYVEDF